jgi:hypothetical protein
MITNMFMDEPIRQETCVKTMDSRWLVICYSPGMKSLIAIILWCILLIMCWPIALALVFLLPLLWLILLPFRIVGFTIEVVFKFIWAVLMFPFRILGR